MPRFMDFHPDYQISAEGIARLRRLAVDGTRDEYGVRQLDLFYNPTGEGVYCLLEGPDEVAVRNHHNGGCNEVIEVESLH
ncbi:MAG TPA: nickel-binding protein [Chloroflexota bacterium]